MSNFPTFLTFVPRCLAVYFTTDMRASTPAALERLDLGVGEGAAVVEEPLAAQPRLLAFHEQQQLVQSHGVSIHVGQNILLYLRVGQAVGDLVHDDLLSVGDLCLTASTLDTVVTHSCQ